MLSVKFVSYIPIYSNEHPIFDFHIIWNLFTEIKMLVYFHYFQEVHVSDPRHAGMPAWTKTDLQGLDLHCLTDLYKTQLGDHKLAASVTLGAEANSMKHIRDLLSHIQLLLKQMNYTLLQNQQRKLSQADNEECRKSWMMVAMVIDRFLLVLFSLLTITISTVLLLNHPLYPYSHIDQAQDTTE